MDWTHHDGQNLASKNKRQILKNIVGKTMSQQMGDMVPRHYTKNIIESKLNEILETHNMPATMGKSPDARSYALRLKMLEMYVYSLTTPQKQEYERSKAFGRPTPDKREIRDHEIKEIKKQLTCCRRLVQA